MIPEGLFDPETWLVYAPISLVFLVVIAYIGGYLKLMHKVKTNYTRKWFHITVFCFAGFLAVFGSFEGVLIYGGIAALFIFFVLWRGDGNIFYEGIAREQDSPNRSLYIILPLITTAVGGVLGRALFDAFSLVGYFVVGLGDAVGEPMGVRFGKHRYKVPTVTKVECTRSIEGSLSVFAVSTISSIILLSYAFGETVLVAVGIGLVIGLVAAIIEAITPHGLDNFTVQFFPLIPAYGLLQLI
jgi:phytol kinase